MIVDLVARGTGAGTATDMSSLACVEFCRGGGEREKQGDGRRDYGGF